MSQPEWMKKFQEIGQKGVEEVTTAGTDGFVKTGEPRRESIDLVTDTTAPAETSGAQSTPTADLTADKESSENEEDDAAALFRAAGSSDPRGESNKSFDTPDPPGDSSSRNSFSSDAVGTDDAGTDDAGIADSSSDPPSGDESESESEEEVDSTGMPDETTADQGEDFGESWVVDQEKAKNRGADGTDADAEAGRQSFNQGESFITEEVYVDEDGNEILVDENGHEMHEDEIQEEEVQEEEVLDDESTDDRIPRQQEDLDPREYDAAPRASNMLPQAANRYDEREQKTHPSEAAPLYDIEEQKRILGVGKKGTRSRMSWCIPILVFAIIVASILLVVFLVVYSEDRAFFGPAPTMAPTPANFLPDPNASSSGNIDAAATTKFDAIQNDCSFGSSGSVQPNIIDQCNCNENVDILANDVRTRWNDLVQSFIPSVFSQWSDPIDSCSPENQALLWLSSGMNNGGEIDNFLRLQRYVLALIYYQQGGPEWSRSTNWLSEKNVCDWEGVECDSNLYIRILNLDRNQLTGQLSDAPTLLNAIEAYFVADNSLVGSIPEAYFSDNSLRYIDFSKNAISGQFPSEISRDSKLNRINLASNSLSGPLPNKIRRIAGLEVLNIESNAFSGTLPDQLFRLKLTELSIGGNEFKGTIPEDLPNVSTLTSLSLGPNLFTGDIPTSLSELTALKKLSISGISDLSGRLPASYGLSLTNLIELTISDTSVGGDIPDLYSKMTRLETLQLSNNFIRGRIPPGLSLMTNLKIISLNGNDLTGTMPSEIGQLSSLQELQVDTNRIFGTIPDEYGNLLEIRSLTLDGNLMNGRVPNGVCALRDSELRKFIVDCPTLTGASQVDGIICSIPDCCTECF